MPGALGTLRVAATTMSARHAASWDDHVRHVGGRREADAPAPLDLVLCEAAARGIRLLGGTHLVRSEGGLRNVAWMAGPEGLVLAHEKAHLFPIERTLGTSEGDGLAVARIGSATVGVARWAARAAGEAHVR